MKYIRTSKGWIIQKTSLYKIKNNHLLEECECGYIDCGEIVAQADTIEELCDEIICVIPTRYNTYMHLHQIAYGKDWSDYKNELKDGKIIYGAIWTDKGLIYVAKMNDKGELELL